VVHLLPTPVVAPLAYVEKFSDQIVVCEKLLITIKKKDT
jgi:hypothetical protein